MGNVLLRSCGAILVSVIAIASASASPIDHPGCANIPAKQCVELALAAMGGRDRLQQLKSVRLKTTGHTLLMEQSYRQDPFIASYERTETTLDLAGQRVLTKLTETWPEADPKQYDSEATFV